MPMDARAHSSDGAGYTSLVDANDVILRGLRNGSAGGRVETTQHDLQGAVDINTYPKEIVSNATLSCDVPSFYSTFWSQHSGFLTRHLTDRKCSDIKCSAWNRLLSASHSFAREVIYICICIYIHTHRHTHTYTHAYIHMYVCHGHV